jgi:outer membrane lipoprotein SlyB
MESFKNMPVVSKVLCVLYVVALVVVFGFAPGAQAQSGNVYGNSQTQSVGTAQEGFILQVQLKEVEATDRARAAGGGIGALIGGAIGNNQADPGHKLVANLLGAAIGGLAGDAVARNTAKNVVQELIIGLINPKTGSVDKVLTVIQPAPFEELNEDDQVLVIKSGTKVRVILRTYAQDRLSMR